MRIINIEQLERHVLDMDLGDSRKVESVVSEYLWQMGCFKVVFIIRNGENTEHCTLRVPQFGIFTPQEMTDEAYYADQMRRWVLGENSIIWMPRQ